jgi:hypothetical protein
MWYYAVEPDGFRVVATVAPGGTGTPVRLEAVLAPNQSVVLSSPRVGSVAPNAIEIRRRGDQVLVHQTAVTNCYRLVKFLRRQVAERIRA